MAISPVPGPIRLRDQSVQPEQHSNAEDGERIEHVPAYTGGANGCRTEWTDHDGVHDAHSHPAKFRQSDGNSELEHASHIGPKHTASLKQKKPPGLHQAASVNQFWFEV